MFTSDYRGPRDLRRVRHHSRHAPRRAGGPAAARAGRARPAAAALCRGASFIHHEVSPAEILAVQGVHRAIRVFVIRHFNEGESARLSREPVANQIDARGSYTDL